MIEKEHLSKDEAFVVEDVSLAGPYNGYRYENAQVKNVADPERLSIVYDSEKNPINKAKLISMAKFMCEDFAQDRVNVVDIKNSESMIVVRKRGK